MLSRKSHPTIFIFSLEKFSTYPHFRISNEEGGHIFNLLIEKFHLIRFDLSNLLHP